VNLKLAIIVLLSFDTCSYCEFKTWGNCKLKIHDKEYKLSKGFSFIDNEYKLNKKRGKK